ncbi:MAG TPA: hypothetical protein VFA18_10145, partial [Gemmataceae bacterium]|nr:hypothetical protein [Gemmataceae bacterium]
QARLARDYPYRTDRPTYHPARLTLTDDGWTVDPVPWLGSPDLRAVTVANAFLVLPVGAQTHQAGTRYPVLLSEGEGEDGWKQA